MKNHIAFKFTAVLLAALLLLTVIASGCSIILLSNYDLYNQTWEQRYEENMLATQENFAETLIFRYASMELGGCSTPLMDDYYGNGSMYTSFRWGRYAYTVRDKNGEELVSLHRDIPNAEHYVIPVENGRFIYLLSEKDVEETTAERLQGTEPVPPAETEIIETVAPVYSTEATISAVEETYAAEETVAAVEETYAAEETVAAVEETYAAAETVAAVEETYAAEETVAAVEETYAAAETVTAVEETYAAEETAAAAEETYAAEETVAAVEETYAAAETVAALEETCAAEETVTAVEETYAAAETVAAAEEAYAAAETAAAAETVPAAEPAAAAEAPQGETDLSYHANPYFTRDQFEEAFSYPYYNYESGTMKDATLCFASTSDYTVDLYLAPDALYEHQTWNMLKIITPLRGQLFAVLGGSLLLFAVMMAYLACAAGRKPGSREVEPVGFNQMPLDLYTAILGAGALGCLWLTSAGVDLFRNTQMIQLLVAGGACFLGCLLLVCYCMAWSAQIKMKHHYWLYNTAVVRVLRLVLSGIVWSGKKLWSGIKQLPGAMRWLGNHVGGWVHRVMMLMPAMYQWLACMGVVLVLILLALFFRTKTLTVLAVLAFVGLTIYGAYCFGILLRGVRNMRAGDLKTKVESPALVGSMKEFAEELNGLADVAGVAAEKQLKSERMKTELITNVSHDIKTPLTSIINYVDLMERPHSLQEQEEYMEVLSRQSQRLKKLIDDLMEMSKASTGNMQTDITEVDAAEAINQCLGEFTDKLERAELSPVFHAPDRQITMMADGRLVWRVMSNLLGNIVKYALPGTRVYVDLNEIGEDVVISVKNVSREELNISSEELMERFVRGDASRNTEGSGLGLNIAKSLMELQHGQMELLVDGDLFKVTLIFPRK